MNARWTIDLYPSRWQNQYGAQFRSTLDHLDASMGDTLDLLVGAARAHLQPDPAWPQTSIAPVVPDYPTPDIRKSALWSIVLWGHISLFIAINVVLIAINLLVTPDNLWFGWPIWGWGIAIAAHIGVTYGSPPWLLPHALVSLWIQVGLVAINIAQGGPAWAVWAVFAMASLLIVHALRANGHVDDFGAHLALVALGAVELLAVAAFTPAGLVEMLNVIGYGLVTVGIHALYRFGNPSLLQAHVLTFAGVSALLVLDSMHEGSRWFLYPVLVWTVLVAVHIAITRMPRPESGTWEREMLLTLRSGDQPTPDQAAARRRVRFAGLRAHLIIAGSLLALLGVINIATSGNGWWIVWPLSIWLVVFAGHIGVVLFAGHPAIGLHLFGGVGAIAWLFVLDMRTGPPTWWYWPAIAWVILGIVVVALTVDLLRGFNDAHAPDPGG